MSNADRTKPVSNGTAELIRRVWKRLGQFFKSRRVRWTVAAIVSVAVAVLYWLSFVRLSNAGLDFSNQLIIPAELRGEISDGRKKFELIVARGSREFHPGISTDTAGINGPYLGPTVRVRRGDQVELTVINELDEMTTMHWHGMHVPARMDGTPHQPIEPGESWTAAFEVGQEAGTMWYHPHPHGYTGAHAYMGIAGLLLIDDENSESLDLPGTYGVDDIPLIIQDRNFTSEGQFQFRRGQGPAYGNRILVNGTLNPFVAVESRLIRFRLLNGSNARTYYIGFEDERQFHQIATDGGFLEKPLVVSRVILAPGERAEILVDFSNGSEALMKSFPEAGLLTTVEGVFDGPGNGHFDLLKIKPETPKRASHSPPSKLNAIERLNPDTADRTRSMALGGPVRGADGRPLPKGKGKGKGGPGGGGIPINGKVMSMDRIDERVRLGDTEIWEISNRTGMMHPFHVHLVQFQILDRDGRAASGADLGWKDTVRVDAGETVRIIAEFTRHADPTTPYMYHCHIMEHEDAGMMGQFLVVEEPENLALLDDKTNVMLFIAGLDCAHCLDQVQTFNAALADFDVQLVVVSAGDEAESELNLRGTLIYDTNRKWAGWFGLAHGTKTHGTVLIDSKGREVWRSVGHEPYMDAPALLRRIARLGQEEKPELNFESELAAVD